MTKHLILDIDSTLIDSDFVDVGCIYKTLPSGINIYPRPYLREFMKFAFDNFESVSLWTAGSSDWADVIVDDILSDFMPSNVAFRFIWTRVKMGIYWTDDNGPLRSYLIKPLSEVYKNFEDMNENNTIIIDDNPITYIRNKRNVIPIIPYDIKKNVNDSEFIRIMNICKN